MLSIKMDYAVKIDYPLNQWDKNSIRPGPVGSVGDCLAAVRIKQSMPDMTPAYSKTFSPKNDPLRGSNVQDGDWASFSTGGYNATVKRQKLHNNTSFKTQHGWIKQDIVAEQRMVEPKVAEQGRQGFETQAAAILYKSGDMFGELPGGYSMPAGVLPRGNMYPRVVGGADGTQGPTMDVVKPVGPSSLPANYSLSGLVSNLPTPANNLNRGVDPAVLAYMISQAQGKDINYPSYQGQGFNPSQAPDMNF